MAGNDTDFHERESRKADARRRVDFDDLNHERAGLETGRMRRFLTAEFRDARDSRKKSEQHSRTMHTLQMLLMNDPEYAARYHEVFDKLRAAEAATEEALALADSALKDANHALQETLVLAPELADGTHVFRDENGVVWTEHGKRVEGPELDTIVWKGNEKSRETYEAQKDSIRHIQEYSHAWREYQTDVLGHARERLADKENPQSTDGLNDIERRVEGQRPTLTINEIILKSTPDKPAQETSADLEVPSL